MTVPLKQALDAIVMMNAHETRKVRDMADAHLRDLDQSTTSWGRAVHFEAALDTCRTCGTIRANHEHELAGSGGNVPVHSFQDEGAELQRGLEVAVERERERLDGADDDFGERAGP